MIRDATAKSPKFFLKTKHKFFKELGTDLAHQPMQDGLIEECKLLGFEATFERTWTSDSSLYASNYTYHTEPVEYLSLKLSWTPEDVDEQEKEESRGKRRGLKRKAQEGGTENQRSLGGEEKKCCT